MSIIAFLIWISFLINDDFNYINDYHSLSTKEQEINFINTYKKTNNISIKAYVISLEMKQAEYKLSPFLKLSIFKNGKKELEELILMYPENVDLRYIRLVIQENVPSILNYKANIIEDKIFLKEKMMIQDESDYLDRYIIKYTSL